MAYELTAKTKLGFGLFSCIIPTPKRRGSSFDISYYIFNPSSSRIWLDHKISDISSNSSPHPCHLGKDQDLKVTSFLKLRLSYEKHWQDVRSLQIMSKIQPWKRNFTPTSESKLPFLPRLSPSPTPTWAGETKTIYPGLSISIWQPFKSRRCEIKLCWYSWGMTDTRVTVRYLVVSNVDRDL